LSWLVAVVVAGDLVLVLAREVVVLAACYLQQDFLSLSELFTQLLLVLVVQAVVLLRGLQGLTQYLHQLPQLGVVAVELVE
jgi:hypothetical protein